MKRVLLVKAGDAAESVTLAVGDYDRWFLETIGPGHRVDRVLAHWGQRLPRPRGYDAVLMTGSPRSVTEPTEWMRRAADWLLEAGAQRVPALGVCFGHQLLGFALGARVVRNPLGREIGTVSVRLTAAGREDPLFAGLPEELTVQATHEDVVERVPAGAVALARNALCSVQALAFGRHLRGVQFHPELQPSAMASVIRARASPLEAEWVARGGPPGERVRTLLAGIRPSPHGRRVLLNFLERFA